MAIFLDISKLNVLLNDYVDYEFIESSRCSKIEFNHQNNEQISLSGRSWTYLDPRKNIVHTITIYFFDNGNIEVQQSQKRKSPLVQAAIDDDLLKYSELYEGSSRNSKFISFQHAIYNQSMEIINFIYSNDHIRSLLYKSYRHPQMYCLYSNSREVFKYIIQFDKYCHNLLLGEILKQNKIDFLKFLIEEKYSDSLEVSGYAKFIIENFQNPKYPHYNNQTVEFWIQHCEISH